MLGGAFACVVFEGDTGYLFDGYLSKMPALKRIKGKPESEPGFENFDTGQSAILVWWQRNNTAPEYGTASTSRMVYGNGFVISEWSEKGARGRMILPDISQEEAFLLFNYVYGYEHDIRDAKGQPCANFEECWAFLLLSASLNGCSGRALAGNKPHFAQDLVIITTECSC